MGQICKENTSGAAGNMQAGPEPVSLQSRRRLPPSAKKIFAVFEDGELHTVQELRKKTGFSIRCTRYAVQLLKESRLIVAKFNFKDARQPLYQKAGITGQSAEFTRTGCSPVAAT